jgi:hypothetical protein
MIYFWIWIQVWISKTSIFNAIQPKVSIRILLSQQLVLSNMNLENYFKICFS